MTLFVSIWLAIGLVSLTIGMLLYKKVNNQESIWGNSITMEDILVILLCIVFGGITLIGMLWYMVKHASAIVIYRRKR